MPGPAAPRIPSCAAGVPIFRTLPPAGLAAVGRILRHRAARRGQAVACAGEPVDHLIIVATGQLKAVRTSPSGREQVVRTLEPGDFVGELALFSPARHENDLVAVTDSDLCLVPRDGMQQILRRYPEVALALVEALAERLAAAERLIADLALLDVGQRLAAELLRMAESGSAAPAAREQPGPMTVRLTIPWAELANRLGTTPESISRQLKALAAQNLITQPDPRTVVILKPRELARLADPPHGDPPRCRS
nr:MAG: hypothetical protein DIU55_13870 [Bacillota bacterium]